METDGRLVEHVQRIDEVRAKGVGEGDPLRLAPRQGARQPVEGEVAQADVVHERDAGRELRQDVHRYRALKRRQLEHRDPVTQPTNRERDDVRDGPAAHTDRQRFGFEPRAAAGGADFRELVLPQEDADVLLVPLRLETLEEWEHAEESTAGAVEQEMTGLPRQVLPRRIERDSLRPCGLAQDATAALVARLGPRIERTLRQALPGVGDDERFVVLQDGAEAIASGAGAPRVVEREQDRRERGSCRAAIRARWVGREATAVAVVERDGNALALVESGGD